jgi:hypothetical protein
MKDRYQSKAMTGLGVIFSPLVHIPTELLHFTSISDQRTCASPPPTKTNLSKDAAVAIANRNGHRRTLAAQAAALKSPRVR